MFYIFKCLFDFQTYQEFEQRFCYAVQNGLVARRSTWYQVSGCYYGTGRVHDFLVYLKIYFQLPTSNITVRGPKPDEL